jgi:hypothetical protein
VRLDGTVLSGGVSEKVRRAFARDGTTLAADCALVEHTLTPDGLARRARPPFLIGVGLLGAVLVVDLTARAAAAARRRRRVV